MENLPSELLQHISDFLDTRRQIYFRMTNRLNYNGIRITDLYHIPKKYRRKLNDNILKQHPHTKYLYCSLHITDISHLTNLIELNASLGTRLSDNHTLSCLKLEKLIAKSNENFIDLNHLTNLKILNISGNCKMTNDGIKNCTQIAKLNIRGTNINNINHLVNLRKLNYHNPNLTTQGFSKCTNLESIICTNDIDNNITMNFNYFTNLRKLGASGCEMLENKDIMMCTNLTELDISFTNISDLNHLTNLQILKASGCNNLTSDGIRQCVNLTKLEFVCSTNITKIDHLKQLECLIIDNGYGTSISDVEINKCITLKKLSVKNNKKIKNINCLTNLTELNASENSGINQDGILACTNLVKLKINNNPHIKNVNHLQKLKYLYIRGICGVDDKGIKKCTKLVTIDVSYNKRVKNLNHLQDLKFLYTSGKNCGVSDKGISECKSLVKIVANGNKKIKK